MTELRASTARTGHLYRGVIREGNRIVWTCEHLHRNRDMSPGVRQSARDCAAQEIRVREVSAEFAELRRLEDRRAAVLQLASTADLRRANPAIGHTIDEAAFRAALEDASRPDADVRLLTRDNFEAVGEWAGVRECWGLNAPRPALHIETPEGVKLAYLGDYVIKDAQGHFWPAASQRLGMR